MKIPILDLKRQYRTLEGEIKDRIDTVLESQSFVLGEEVKIFEEKIASFCKTRYAIGVNSGTDAIILALNAMAVEADDEVITTPFTFMATAEAIVRAGAKPVFVDITRETYTIEPRLIETRLTEKTKAILPVHLYGLCADMEPILKIAKEHGLKVLEDCAQAIGSEYKGERSGSMGDSGALSFYPGKNLGCFGDGGMVVTNNPDIYERLLLLRNHGTYKKYHHKLVGYNSRLDNLQAAVLDAKLAYLDEWIDARIKNAAFFTRELEDYPLLPPSVPNGYRHSFHLYVLRSKDAPRLVDYLNKNGIEARTYYPLPLHLQECFKYLGYHEDDFPESEKLSREGFAIPVYPELTDEEKGYIVAIIKRFFDTQ